MSEDSLEYIALQWSSRIHDRPLPDKLEGVYDAEHNEIILSDRLSTVQRRCVLAHEISHAKGRPCRSIHRAACRHGGCTNAHKPSRLRYCRNPIRQRRMRNSKRTERDALGNQGLQTMAA